MKRILIFERETSTINMLKQMIEAINYHPTVFLNWNNSINIALNEIAAIFINIELPGIEVPKIANYFNASGQPEIPIYLLISQKNLELYEKVKNINHSGKLIKPFKLEEIYYILDTQLNLNQISLDQFDLHYQYKKFVEYSNELDKWLDSLKTLIK